MSNILVELLKSFGGGGDLKGDIGRVKQNVATGAGQTQAFDRLVDSIMATEDGYNAASEEASKMQIASELEAAVRGASGTDIAGGLAGAAKGAAETDVRQGLADVATEGRDTLARVKDLMTEDDPIARRALMAAAAKAADWAGAGGSKLADMFGAGTQAPGEVLTKGSAPAFVSRQMLPDTGAIPGGSKTAAGAVRIFGGGGGRGSMPRALPAGGGEPLNPAFMPEAIPGAVDTSKDATIAASEKDKTGKAIKQRDLEGRADAPESTESQIAKAIVGLLPGLLGMGVGAATGGGYGAAAGAAGGFSGAGAGLARMDDVAREEKGKLVARAEKEGDRIGDIDKQIAVRKAMLEDRSLSQQEHAKQRNAVKELEMQRQRFQTQSDAEGRRFTAGENAKNRGQADRHLAAQLAQRDTDSLRDYYAKLEASRGAAGGMKEHQQKLALLLPTIADSVNTVDTMEAKGTPPQAGVVSNTWNAAVPRFMESDDWRRYEDAKKAFAQHYTFALSGAQAPETEVARMGDIFFAKTSDDAKQIAHKRALRSNAMKIIQAAVTNPAQLQLISAEAGKIGLPVPGISTEVNPNFAPLQQKYGF